MDVWRCAILRQTAERASRDGIDPAAVVWLPDMPPLSFLADPFGLWRCGRLHVFVEAFDYRTRHGHIDVLVYDDSLRLLDRRTVLAAPWHLSYPFVFAADGEVWMLPEAYRSGTLTLYRARDFPWAWEPALDIPLDGPAIDATPLFHGGRWWLFYTPGRHKAARRSHLHVAWADRLGGPWRLHPGNPVRVDPSAARPGGTARVEGGAVVLPVQDCRASYGGALRELVITRLSETAWAAHDRACLAAPPWMAPYSAGPHTLSAAGAVCLIDVKRMENSVAANAIRLRGLWSALRRGRSRRDNRFAVEQPPR